METNARYLLIGTFTLTVIAMVFGFVFWLENAGGLGRKVSYLVHFENSVSGLQPGAAVLFDGMRVGEVSALNLDPGDPRVVLAGIAVNAGTPVRRDTKVGLEFQGLMGAAVISLQGGSPAAPLPFGIDGQAPLLMADPAAGQSLMEAARQTLQHVDKVLADNSESLHATMDNLKSFSGALAQSSDRVGGIMAGLERMTGGGPAKILPKVFDLAVPKVDPFTGPGQQDQISIADPTSVEALQTQQLLTRSADGLIARLGEVQWSDTLPKLVQEKILQSFEDAGIPAKLNSPLEAGQGKQLQIDIRSFDISTDGDLAADVAFSAKIVSGDGRLLGTRVFEAKVPCTSLDPIVAVKALNVAFGRVVDELSAWHRTT